MRVGVNTGEVVAGEHGRGQALVTGDAVNVAARLEQAAPAGGIVIGELTYHALRGRADVEVVAPVEAKGKTLPLAAWRLLALHELDPPSRLRSARLVGRDEELQQLRALLARVASRQRADMVLVAGEAGSGKSRLVSEFAANCQCRALTGTCPSYGRGNTYRPLRELIEAAVPLMTRSDLMGLFKLQDDAPTTASRLLRLISVESGPVTAAEAFTAVARLIAALAGGEMPLVIVVEDLHWAEPTLIDLLQFLVEAASSPVLFIGTAREDFLEQGHARLADSVIHMQPLSDDAARALLAQHTRLDVRETETVVERADGNPFFLEQLAAWRSEGQLGVPPDVVGVIAARLDSLDFEARLVIEAASVVGRDFLPRALETLIGDEAGVNVPRGLLHLESRGFVASGASSASQGPTGLSGVFGGGGRLHFSHTLVFDAVRSAMPKARRADLHERFAADLKQRPGYEAAVAAYHLEQAARLRMELRPRDGLPEVALAAAAQLEQARLRGARARGRPGGNGAAVARSRAPAVCAQRDSGAEIELKTRLPRRAPCPHEHRASKRFCAASRPAPRSACSEVRPRQRRVSPNRFQMATGCAPGTSGPLPKMGV